jgi:hypothetical protein
MLLINCSGATIGVTASPQVGPEGFDVENTAGLSGYNYNISAGVEFFAGDVCGISIDFEKDKVVFYRNGERFAKGNRKPSEMENVYLCAFLFYPGDQLRLLTQHEYAPDDHQQEE